MTNQEILDQASQLDAVNFVRFLESNKIGYGILDCNLMDYNDDYFNVEVDGFERGDSLLFLDGEFQN
jgi:hypothetical protein